MRIFNITLFSSFLLVASIKSTAQGCSDAGFCTIGSFKHLPPAGQQVKHRVGLQFPGGSGDENVFVFTPAVQYDLQTGNWSLQAKLTGNYASGNLASVWAPGDLYLSSTRVFGVKGSRNWQATAGFKIPLSAPTFSDKGRPLPMQYQGSLGTLDLIAGLTGNFRSWSFSFALQQPLTGENSNGFLAEYWNGHPDAGAYPPSNRFRRKGDLLLRAGKNFTAGSKWSFTAGLLSILHLGRDRYTAIQPVQELRVINGSEGLTINLTGSAWLQLSKKTRLGLSAGKPLLVRDIRPDGLTRSWILSPEISWQF